jgi:regulatory protein
MDETEYERLLGAAIRFISFRPRSEKEIRDFCAKTLKRHHTTAPLVVDKVMARLADFGYVDDMKFVDWWVNQRTSFRQKGARLVAMELRAKGISRDVVESYFANTPQAASERELAIKAIGRKIVIWQKLPVQIRKQKLIAFLMRRGFDSETIYSVVDDAVGKE